MDYRYRGYSKNNKSGKGGKIVFRVVLLLIIILLLIAAIYSGINALNNNMKEKDMAIQIKSAYRKLYVEKNYLGLINKMDHELSDNPFDVEYLTYRGYSYFFLGEEENDLNRRKKFFRLSLGDLRKALAIGIPEKNRANIYFCIGKIYYYLGRAYYNQSIKYLNLSLLDGNSRPDLLYILGLVYSNSGNYQAAVAVFERALTIEESDLVLLALGMNFHKKGDYRQAVNYLERAGKSSKEAKIIEKSLFTIAEIHFQEKEYSQALDYLNRVIEMNENNANAFFYRGEIYYLYNNVIKARAEWRKTLALDPSHIQAKTRLY